MSREHEGSIQRVAFWAIVSSILILIVAGSVFGLEWFILATVKEEHMDQDYYERNGADDSQHFIPEACAASM